MSKDKISDYSATANSNTDIGGIDIDEGCAPSGINNAIRTLMKQIKDLYAGTSGDTWPVTAGGTGSGTASGARTNLGLAIGTDVQAYDADLAAIASSGKGAEIASYGTYGVGFKNRIINGAMVIDQRNAGASLTTNGAYCLDRWYFETSNTGNNSVQQSTDVPTGFYNSLKITTNTGGSVSSGSYLDVSQKIEGFNCSDFGWGSASASKVTVSFWVKSSVTGTYSVNLRMPLAGTPVGSVQTYTINSANTWEQKFVTFTGNTATALLGANTGQLSVYFFLASGSTYQTASTDTWVTTGSGFVSSSSQSTGMLTTTGATFYITGVQLEKGSTATSFDYRPYGTELALCQRYYEKSFEMGTAPAQNTGSYNGTAVASSPGQLSGMSFGDTRFKVNKRASPTITFFNPAAANAFARDQNAGVNCSATSAWVAGESSFAITASTGSGSGATNRIGVHWTAESEL